jgi:hypothetical protein
MMNRRTKPVYEGWYEGWALIILIQLCYLPLVHILLRNLSLIDNLDSQWKDELHARTSVVRYVVYTMVFSSGTMVGIFVMVSCFVPRLEKKEDGAMTEEPEMDEESKVPLILSYEIKM